MCICVHVAKNEEKPYRTLNGKKETTKVARREERQEIAMTIYSMKYYLLLRKIEKMSVFPLAGSVLLILFFFLVQENRRATPLTLHH